MGQISQGGPSSSESQISAFRQHHSGLKGNPSVIPCVADEPNHSAAPVWNSRSSSSFFPESPTAHGTWFPTVQEALQSEVAGPHYGTTLSLSLLYNQLASLCHP